MSADLRCTTFAALVATAGLTNEFTKAGQRTLCAPSNDAFAALTPESIERLKRIEHRGQLVTFLLAHLFEGTRARSVISVYSTLTACGGQTIPISVQGDIVSVGDGRIVRGNLVAANGVVHVVDRSVVPIPVLPDAAPGR